jgi:DNA repair protein RadA/Sms
MEGRRPMLGEVQALVTPSASDRPRRATSGIDSSRLAMILAVLQQHVGLRLSNHDVFVSTVGGARLTEASTDLPVALAIVSAAMGRPLGRRVAAIGEIGLSGEVRRVRDLGVRLNEASRMGFRAAVVPAEDVARSGSSRVLDGMRVTDLRDLGQALTVLGLEMGSGRAWAGQ